MAAKSGENRNFSPRHRILLYYPVGQKFARNRSISYQFEDIFNVSFSAKIQDGRQKVAKIEIFPLCIGYSCTALWVKNLLEIALSLTVFRDICDFFYISTKSSNKVAITHLYIEQQVCNLNMSQFTKKIDEQHI